MTDSLVTAVKLILAWIFVVVTTTVSVQFFNSHNLINWLIGGTGIGCSILGFYFYCRNLFQIKG